MGLIRTLSPFHKPRPHKTRGGKIGLTLAAHDIDVVIDLGANEGQSYEQLRENGFEKTIISVEPLHTLQEKLEARAQKDPDWHVLSPLAIGDQNDTTQIHVSEASDMSSVMTSTDQLLSAIPKTRSDHTLEVEMKTLDTLYEQLEDDFDLAGKNVFLKMDVQGLEMPILKSASKTLAKLSGLQVEMSLFPLYEGEVTYDEIIPFLATQGFEAHMLIETNFSRTLNRQLQIDGVFYRK